MNHRHIIAGLYLAYGFCLVILYALWSPVLFSAFGGSSDPFAIVDNVLTILLLLAPVSCCVLACILYAGARHFVLILLATHIALFSPFSLVIAVYLLWWYRSDKSRAQAATHGRRSP